MINLLPDDYKAEIRAGRLNVIFLNYIIMAIFATAFMTVLTGLAFVTLSAGRQAAQNRVTENDTAISKFSAVEQAASSYRNDLATAKLILDKSVDYSSLVARIGKITPSGVVFTALNLDTKTLGTPTTLTALAKSKDAVLALKSSMQDHPELFTNVSLQQVQISETPNTPYPYTAILNVTINKSAVTK